MSQPIRRHPLVAFFVLACALSWWPVAFGAFLPFGPLVSALIVTSVLEGRSGRRTLWRRLLQWRVGLRWYAAALLIPVVVVGVAIAVTVAAGAPASAVSELGP